MDKQKNQELVNRLNKIREEAKDIMSILHRRGTSVAIQNNQVYILNNGREED